MIRASNPEQWWVDIFMSKQRKVESVKDKTNGFEYIKI